MTGMTAKTGMTEELARALKSAADQATLLAEYLQGANSHTLDLEFVGRHALLLNEYAEAARSASRRAEGCCGEPYITRSINNASRP